MSNRKKYKQDEEKLKFDTKTDEKKVLIIYNGYVLFLQFVTFVTFPKEFEVTVREGCEGCEGS